MSAPTLDDLLSDAASHAGAAKAEADRAFDAVLDENPGRVANALACLQEHVEALSKTYNRLALLASIREVA